MKPSLVAFVEVEARPLHCTQYTVSWQIQAVATIKLGARPSASHSRTCLRLRSDRRSAEHMYVALSGHYLVVDADWAVAVAPWLQIQGSARCWST